MNAETRIVAAELFYARLENIEVLDFRILAAAIDLAAGTRSGNWNPALMQRCVQIYDRRAEFPHYGEEYKKWVKKSVKYYREVLVRDGYL